MWIMFAWWKCSFLRESIFLFHFCSYHSICKEMILTMYKDNWEVSEIGRRFPGLLRKLFWWDFYIRHSFIRDMLVLVSVRFAHAGIHPCIVVIVWRWKLLACNRMIVHTRHWVCSVSVEWSGFKGKDFWPNWINI